MASGHEKNQNAASTQNQHTAAVQQQNTGTINKPDLKTGDRANISTTQPARRRLMLLPWAWHAKWRPPARACARWHPALPILIFMRRPASPTARPASYITGTVISCTGGL